YLVGEESLLRKGHGKRMIAVLVEKIFSLTDAQRVTASIDDRNTASKRALLANGFFLFDAERSRYVLDKTRRN
ncbi:MAG: acetyltransferase, partial [Planctomycetes bacterium]|nr:acetyltransferase [Planctomycetota bacterium]